MACLTPHPPTLSERSSVLESLLVFSYNILLYYISIPISTSIEPSPTPPGIGRQVCPNAPVTPGWHPGGTPVGSGKTRANRKRKGCRPAGAPRLDFYRFFGIFFVHHVFVMDFTRFWQPFQHNCPYFCMYFSAIILLSILSFFYRYYHSFINIIMLLSILSFFYQYYHYFIIIIIILSSLYIISKKLISTLGPKF